jgi:hypothetical protein
LQALEGNQSLGLPGSPGIANHHVNDCVMASL